VEVAAGRPFVWIDDEITGTDRTWVTDNHQGSALLFRIDAHFGLAEADLAAVERWLRNLRRTDRRKPGPSWTAVRM
jgi:hypothetical protein